MYVRTITPRPHCTQDDDCEMRINGAKRTLSKEDERSSDRVHVLGKKQVLFAFLVNRIVLFSVDIVPFGCWYLCAWENGQFLIFPNALSLPILRGVSYRCYCLVFITKKNEEKKKKLQCVFVPQLVMK